MQSKLLLENFLQYNDRVLVWSSAYTTTTTTVQG